MFMARSVAVPVRGAKAVAESALQSRGRTG
jgi:hypothetical protein